MAIQVSISRMIELFKFFLIKDDIELLVVYDKYC